MKLIHSGSEVYSVLCLTVGDYVVDTVAKDGRLVLAITDVGSLSLRHDVANTPPSCPLTRDVANRNLGMFAVCDNCQFAKTSTADDGEYSGV